MHRAIFFAVCAFAIVAPSVTRGSIRLHVFDTSGMLGLDSTMRVDVYAQGTDDEDEQLWAYDIAVTLRPSRPGPVNGLRFVAPYVEKPASQYVFGGEPTTFSLSQSLPPTDSTLMFSVLNQGALVDVPRDQLVRLGTLLLEIDPAATPSSYRLEFDRMNTLFASGEIRVDPLIQTDLGNGATISLLFLPEPSSAATLAVPAAAIFLRRRRAA